MAFIVILNLVMSIAEGAAKDLAHESAEQDPLPCAGNSSYNSNK
jgi:hypothetical protein